MFIAREVTAKKTDPKTAKKGPGAAKDAAKRTRAAAPKAGGEKAPKRRKKAEDVIPIDGSGSEAVGEDEEEPAGVSRAGLRTILRQTRERIMGGAGTPRAPKPPEARDGGVSRAGISRAVGGSGLSTGTILRPGKMTPLALESGEAISGGDMRGSKKKTKHLSSTSNALLAQAVQASMEEASEKKRRRRAKGEKEPHQAASQSAAGKEGQKAVFKIQEERPPASKQDEAGSRRVWRIRRRKPKRLKLEFGLRRGRGEERGRLRPRMRAATPEEGPARTRKCPGDAAEACPAAARQRL